MNTGACALWGPGKPARRPLTSRITVHLIGCSATPVSSVFLLWLQADSCVLTTCKVLKNLALQRPSGTLSFLVLRM